MSDLETSKSDTRYLPGSVTLLQFLRDRKLLTAEQATKLRAYVEAKQVNFGTAVMSLGFIDSENLGELLQNEFGIKFVRSFQGTVTLSARKRIEFEKARSMQVFPLVITRKKGEPVISVGMTDPLETFTIARLEAHCQMRVEPVFITLSYLQRLYQKYFQAAFVLESSSKDLDAFYQPGPRKDMVTALVSLLERKGLISKQELVDEMDGLKKV